MEHRIIICIIAGCVAGTCLPPQEPQAPYFVIFKGGAGALHIPNLPDFKMLASQTSLIDSNTAFIMSNSPGYLPNARC
jgi:hypothetical protein